MSEKNCLFCRIISGEIPSEKVFEDDMILAFRDIKPVAPTHILVIPRIHIDSLNDINENRENIAYVSRILEKIPEIAKLTGIFDDGYRVVTNIGENGGQSVGHLHFHVVGGRKLTWSF